MKIPGRVGYQCSNFYRQLVRDGEIKDENYEVNSDGKLVFRLRNSAGKNMEKRKRAGTSTSKSRKRARQESSSDEEAEEEEKGEVLPVGESGWSERKDYIDPMTMMPVQTPAISPYGHVMGYDSWVKVLNRNPKNTCPFTKKVGLERRIEGRN